MEETGIKDRINKFCLDKNISNPFIKECITEFIEGHTSLFGDIVSTDELFDRLESNLDKITYAGKIGGVRLGEYKGRIKDNTDQNEILIYADESDLEISEVDQKMWELYTNEDKQKLLEERDKKREEIKSTIIHELTHCAYTIKDSYGIGEKHIFSRNGKNLFGADYYSFVGGNSNYVEAIVNFISSKIEGKSVERIQTYEYETKAIYMLAEKMGEKSIIKSAWDSDEVSFQQSYEEKVGENYTSFNNSMRELVVIRNNRNLDVEQYFSRSKTCLSNIEQILEGKELKKREIQDVPKKDEEISPIGKIGFEDVSHTTAIRRPMLDKATNFVKKLFQNKQKMKETEEERE